MANPGNAAIDASSPVGVADIRNLLADLEGARGFFSGKLIDYRMPCTASEDRTCQIVANLSVWNEFLWPLELELRELPESGRQLGLVKLQNTCLSWPTKGQLHVALTVLYWLLNIHHCVARMHVTDMMTVSGSVELCIPVLWKTLYGNSSLKSVIFDSLFAVESKYAQIEKLFEVVLSLKCLEQLEFPHYALLCPRSVSAILRSTTTLTVLDWSSVEHIESTLAQQFLTVLRTNSTLRDLSLSVAVINAGPALFVEFLACHTRLQKLRVVYSCYCCTDDSLRWILKGMLKNRSVSSLHAEVVTVDFESMELASKVFAENRVLRSFRLWLSTMAKGVSLCIKMPPNITALQDAMARNNTLQYMTLYFSIWSAEHWEPFFCVLSKHPSLKMVTIDVEEEEYRLLPDVVKALQQSGCEEKVYFNARRIANRLSVPDCKPFCELSIVVNHWTKERMLPFSQQLSMFSRLKALSLVVTTWDTGILYAISEYIAMTSTLRKLDMDFRMSIFPPELIEWWPTLPRSLLLNRSIAELSIGVNSCQNIKLLGDAVMRSQNIRKLTLMKSHSLALGCFMLGLRADILKNYTLCTVTGDFYHLNFKEDWFAVRDTSRRNSGFVARAAQFLNHARCYRLCAAGLDRVSRHPALVAELAEVLSIGEDEAAHMVRREFRSIEGLHEFMRLAGVVKQRVTCQPREDGRAQLDDINCECWCHVRRYLQLDDVAFD